MGNWKLLSRERTIAPNDIVLKDRTISWKVRGLNDANGQFVSCFRYANSSTTVTRDLNGAFIRRETENVTFDEYGFRTRIEHLTENEDGTDVFSKVVDNTYTHDTTNWRLGQLTQSRETGSKGHREDQTVTTRETQTVVHTDVVDENFEGTVSGWSNNTVENGGSANTIFLGRNNGLGSTASQQVYKTFAIPTSATEVKIEFDFYEIGWWNNKQFRVYVNDQQFSSGNFNYNCCNPDTGNADFAPVNSSNLNGEVLQRYRFSRTIPITGNSGSIKIGFVALRHSPRT